MKQLYTLVLTINLIAASNTITYSQTDQNTLLGYEAGYFNTATANVFLGYRAGRLNTSGTYNTFIGVQAGLNNTTGNSNFMMGVNAGVNNTTGTANFFLGNNAGGANTSGSYNVFLGANAGQVNTSGGNNTVIGFGANLGSGNLINATAIGNNAQVNTSNSLILGNSVNVGIGNMAPANKLEITQGSSGNSGLRFTNLTSSTPASITNQTKFLTVNASGDVVMGSLNSSSRLASNAELWKASGDYVQNVGTAGVVIGNGQSKTPAGYKLFVEEGILTEKVKVAVKTTSEWSDKVFDEKYSLKRLSEVEAYIKLYKHLPGIPSAQEMVEKGNDLHKTDANLLEKIEELTLYLIQQKGELDVLRQQNQLIKEELKALKKTNH